MYDVKNTRALTKIQLIAGVLMIGISTLLATGCGSTKVYSSDKTLEYKGSIYNVSEVRQLSTRIEALPASGGVIDLQGYDNKQFDALVKEKGALPVRSVIALDDKEIVYQQMTVGKGRDFGKMQEAFADAYKKLTSFMADARKTQLKL